MSLPENISSPNVSEPVVRHQPKKKSNTLLPPGSDLNQQLGQSVIKRSSQDKQAVRKMRCAKCHSGAVGIPLPNFAGLVSFNTIPLVAQIPGHSAHSLSAKSLQYTSCNISRSRSDRAP